MEEPSAGATRTSRVLRWWSGRPCGHPIRWRTGERSVPGVRLVEELRVAGEFGRSSRSGLLLRRRLRLVLRRRLGLLLFHRRGVLFVGRLGLLPLHGRSVLPVGWLG